MTDINLRILLNAVKGNTTNVIGDVTKALGSQAGGLQGAMLAVGVGAAALAIGIGVKAVNAAREYQSAMTQLQNTTNSSDAQMKQYTATIRSLSDETGTAQTDLAKGMYQIISANFAGADAERILTTATKAAIIAGADQATVTTGLVVTLNAFGLKANQVDSVSNRMFKTLSLGRGQMNDLAGALQTGGALVAHYGVSVTDMDATLATLSTGGMKTFGTSMTGLTQLLNVMDGKTDLIAKRINALGGTYTYTTEKTKQIYDAHHRLDGKLITVMGHMETIYTKHTGKLGLGFDEAKFKAMDFQHQIAYLTEIFKGHEKQMVAVLGSKQAATALGILGTQSQLLASNLKKLSDAQELAKEKQDAWAKVQHDFNFQWQKFQTNMQNLLIDLGMKLLPYLTPIVKQFSDWAVNLQYSFVPAVQNLIGWFQQGGPAVEVVKTALEGVMAALVAKKVYDTAQGFISLGKNAADFVTNAGQKLLNFFTNDLTGAAAKSALAEEAVGTTAKTTMAEDVAAGSAEAELSIAGVGTEADVVEGQVKTASASMSASLSGVLGLYSALLVGVPIIEQKVHDQAGPLAAEIARWKAANPGQSLPPYLVKAAKDAGITDPGSIIASTPGIHSRIPGHASGVTNFSGGLAYVHQGEVLSNLAPGTNVTPASRVSLGGGLNITINVSTLAGSRSEVMRMVDLLEQEIASRFRGQTPSFGFGGVL